jgi:3-oxo-5-alpha-steroid 4-dehydrogenase 1
MSPIHIFVWASAFAFQVINATCIGGWLAGYGPTTTADWGEQMVNTQVGLMLFVAGLFGNIFHDDELREIRRQAMKEQEERSKTKGESGGRGVDKVYRIPRAGLFEYILFPHYLCEWIEWLGYWVIGGLGFVPARSFLLNEIATMSARAVQGKRWYVERFGKEAIGTRKAVIPGLL